MSRSEAASLAEAPGFLTDNVQSVGCETPSHGIGDGALFFRAWLCRPVTIGAIMPTRTALARAMARAAASVGYGSVVELGGGTGPITRALVDSVPSPRSLVVIERDPTLHRLLTHRFPALRILRGDAEDLLSILGVEDMGRVGTIVSSLPRVGWSLGRQRRILEQCFSLLAAEGVFLEFSYGACSPVPSILVNELSLVAQRLERLWANFPPATVWGYRRVRAIRSAEQALSSEGTHITRPGRHRRPSRGGPESV